MYNPFLEADEDARQDIELVERARNGDRAALEALILKHQAWIYNIAVRMVFQPHDAEEVTQEVLLKAITRLSTFEGKSQFRTWLYRITVNHVLNMKRRGGETEPHTFSSYAAAINNIPDLDLPDPKTVPVEIPLLVEEAKIACMTGMLLCLDRRQRLIFTLGEIFGVSDRVGSEIMEISAASFRQNLSRARRDLYQFMQNQCGLVNEKNPCRCPKKTKGFINEGHVDPEHLLFVPEHFERINEVASGTVREIEDAVDRQYAALQRSYPFLQPDNPPARWLQEILEQPGIRTALHLN